MHSLNYENMWEHAFPSMKTCVPMLGQKFPIWEAIVNISFQCTPKCHLGATWVPHKRHMRAM